MEHILSSEELEALFAEPKGVKSSKTSSNVDRVLNQVQTMVQHWLISWKAWGAKALKMQVLEGISCHYDELSGQWDGQHNCWSMATDSGELLGQVIISKQMQCSWIDMILGGDGQLLSVPQKFSLLENKLLDMIWDKWAAVWQEQLGSEGAKIIVKNEQFWGPVVGIEPKKQVYSIKILVEAGLCRDTMHLIMLHKQEGKEELR